MPVYSEVVVNRYFVQKRSICSTLSRINSDYTNVQCTWYCSSFIHREVLRAQLQIDRFRFVNYQKFVTKRVILRMEVQTGKNNFDGGSKQFLLGGIWSHGTW